MSHDFSGHRRAVLRAGLGVAAVAVAPGLVGCATASGSRKGFFAEHDLPIGIQLYMLGDVATTDLDGTLKRVAGIGYRTVELPGLKPGTAPQVRAAADNAGLTIGSVHVAANPIIAQGQMTVQADPGRLADDMRTLGCRDVVVAFPVLPAVKPAAGEDLAAAMKRAFRTSTDHWQRTAALLNERAALLRREGLALSYHNHDLEFIPVSGTRGWDVLMAELDPEVSFELDVAWLVAGGQDPVAFIEQLAGRVRQLHVKDLHTPSQPHEALKMESTEVGSGVIEWRKVLHAAWRAGVRQFYVEQEPPYKLDRFEAAAKSYAYLSSV